MAADMDLMTLMEDFDTDTECRTALERIRWPEGVMCPRCQSPKHQYDSNAKVYDCVSCGYKFSVTAGTIFHDSHLPLPKWFAAIYLMVESKKGMSANQMGRTLHVSYKTAWYLCHRIRAAMAEADAPLLSGIVEVDETYVGGKRKHVGQGYKKNKTIVAGIKQRGGDLRMQVVPSTRKKTLQAFVNDHVGPETEAVFTDELPSYDGIETETMRHEAVNHRAEEWVRGDVHTNGIESAWSLFKRSVVGSYHRVSAKHLDSYLDEAEWRFNNRKNPRLFRDTLKKLLDAGTLPYQTLTNKL